MGETVKLAQEIADFDTLLKNTTSIAEKTYEVMTQFAERYKNNNSSSDFSEIINLYQMYLTEIWSDPNKVFEAQMKYWGDLLQLWQNTTLSWLGIHVDPIIESKKSDKRFRDEEWDKLPLFAFIKQSYLLNAQYMQNMVSEVEGMDDKSKSQLKFYTRQFVNALSPSNFIVTNPEVLQKTLSTKGENLVNGLNNMLNDLANNRSDSFNISMTDMKAFEVGKNIATTKGSVVFQNDMIQLIQYEALTKEVYKKPMLIIPPWINKFYILDLQPENSLVKYLSEQGFTTFMISWVNPDKSYAECDFSHYMLNGPLAAINVIKEITGEKDINVTGYCIGGTLLAGLLSYLTSKNDPIVNSATYLATMIDFSEPGDLGVFIDENQLDNLEQKMKKQGYLAGSAMSTSFNMLRSNELIWNYYINNYLLGNEPFPFDLLYWNCDNTNLPYAMHSFYLRKMYLENIYCKPNKVKLDNIPIDISQVKTPAYFISAHGDHIAPWQSTYKGALLHSGEVRFVLGGSGHIAGIVNPPQKKKYAYWTNKKLLANAEEWFSTADEHPGSWWTDWVNWLEKRSGDKISARKIGSKAYPKLEPAPGSFVKVNCKNEDQTN